MLISPSFPRVAIVTALAVALTGCDRIQQYFNQPAPNPTGDHPTSWGTRRDVGG